MALGQPDNLFRKHHFYRTTVSEFYRAKMGIPSMSRGFAHFAKWVYPFCAEGIPDFSSSYVFFVFSSDDTSTSGFLFSYEYCRAALNSVFSRAFSESTGNYGITRVMPLMVIP